MCGLNGIFAYNPAANAPSEVELIATRDHMSARGPNGFGQWWSENRRLGLGHRRLSILDLSERANQPMSSADGRLVIVFNGEIYNYPALRKALEARGRVFRTTSDTEALLHLYALEGPDMVHQLRGMFAFAIWDSTKRGLLLARDPYGIKPLYTANDGWTFRFASQVKALLAGGKVSRDPEPAGIVGFHLWGSVPEPFTLYRDIQSLPAGHTQWIDDAGPRDPRTYANLASVLAEGAHHPAPKRELAGRVRSAVSDSVTAHMLADVDVGVFLSAGIDSCALLGMMREAHAGPISAITLAFSEFEGTPEDEAPLAALVAAQYGAEHTVRRVDEAEFRTDLPAILEAMDQPSIDGVNTWFVAKAAREAGLKVALSGLGGDELLAGYPSFTDIPRWVSKLGLPSAIPGLGTLVRRSAQVLGLAANRPKARGLLEYGGDYSGAYLLRRGLFLPFELPALLDPSMVKDGMNSLRPLQRVRAMMSPDPRHPLARVTAMESAGYLRNQLLRDADWAGMAHSLEIRTPLVDYALLAALAPVVPHLSARAGKMALADAPQSPMPHAVVDRPKTGFGVPTGRWMGQASTGGKGGDSRAWARRVFSGAISDASSTPQPTELTREQHSRSVHDVAHIG